MDGLQSRGKIEKSVKLKFLEKINDCDMLDKEDKFIKEVNCVNGVDSQLKTFFHLPGTPKSLLK